MSAVNSIYHIVINTYRREKTIPDETSEHMYRYIWSIINSRNCKPVVEVPLRGTFRKIQQGPSCEPLWGSCMVLRLKSGLRPARHLRCPMSQPNTGFCRCPNILVFFCLRITCVAIFGRGIHKDIKKTTRVAGGFSFLQW